MEEGFAGFWGGYQPELLLPRSDNIRLSVTPLAAQQHLCCQEIRLIPLPEITQWFPPQGTAYITQEREQRPASRRRSRFLPASPRTTPGGRRGLRFKCRPRWAADAPQGCTGGFTMKPARRRRVLNPARPWGKPLCGPRASHLRGPTWARILQQA